MTRKPPKGESLAEVNPDLAKECRQTKSSSLSTFDVTPGSSMKVWWKCNRSGDHELKTLIKDRSKGIGCPIYSNYLFIFVDIHK